MATIVASDPYKILGVETDVDSAAIKKAYRKLVLSCHPDKVTDESLKAQKQEEFHQIQQAYETIGDPDNRNKYELELKARRLKEERERAAPKASSAQTRGVNINIYTAQHPSEHRSPSTKYSPSPSKSASSKPYSATFSRSWDHSMPTRSREAYEADRKTRRTYSDERLNDDSKERRRREEDRERKRRQDEDDERRRRQAKRDKEAALEREMKDRARAKEAARRREQEREERLRAELKAEKRARERAAAERESKRRQEAADEKIRAKMRSHEQHTSEEDDEKRSRAKRLPKKDSPRDKTPSKPRERPSPRDETAPEVPNTADADAKLESRLHYAACYIRDQKKSKASSPKQTAEAPIFSDAYPDPNQWVPKRRVSGEKAAKVTAEPVSLDANSTPVSPSASQGPPPRLQKAYTTMGHVPTSDARPPTLGRSQTFDQEAFSRSMGSSERPRVARQRTTLDEEDFYVAPRVQKYSVGREKGLPRVFETTQYRDPYVAPGGTFPKVKTTQAYGTEHINHSKRYDPADITFADYQTASQQAYVATHT